MRNKILGSLLLAFTLILIGCEKDGPAEKAGEKIDNITKDIKDNTNSAIEEAGDAIEEAGEKIEKKTD